MDTMDCMGTSTALSSAQAGHRCHNFLNSIHSTIYFSPDLGEELTVFGISDPMVVYFIGRAAAFGAVGAGPVTATFHGFKHELITRHFPQIWDLVPPEIVLAARLRAADRTLRRFLSEETITSTEMTEAAELALHACEACVRPAHPLYAAHADLPIPEASHLALWHAATLLREHRGDNHFAVLTYHGIGGLESLVSHSASRDGMPKEMVMTKRGWTQEDWTIAENRLRLRGLIDPDGELTLKGVKLRRELEEETDRLDQAPYKHLGTFGLDRLTELAAGFTTEAAAAGAFPPPLAEFFIRG